MREYEAFRVNTIEECIEAIRNDKRNIEYPKEIENQLFNYLEKLRAIFRPSAWAAFGMDKEGADYRACANFGPLYR